MFKYQHEMMKYMYQLADLFLKESGMFNLFIQENITRFLHDVGIQKRQNTIFDSPVKGGKSYEHILFDGVVYGDIPDQLMDLQGTPESLRIMTLLESEGVKPTKPYSGIEKLILGKGFGGFSHKFSLSDRQGNLLSTIFTTFPNLRELVFRDCFNSKINKNKKITKINLYLGSVRAVNLTSLILRDTEIEFDFNQFENLEYLEIENNPAIRAIKLENEKIKTVVLSSLKVLNHLCVKKLRLEMLKLVNLDDLANQVSLGEVAKLVIEESFPENITVSKKILDLQLSDVKLNLENLKKVIPKPGGFSLARKKSGLLHLIL